MLFVIPRSTLPLVVALSLWMWRGSSIYEVLTGGPDWAWANRTTSMCNPALVRMKRLFELGTDKSRAKDAALLGKRLVDSREVLDVPRQASLAGSETNMCNPANLWRPRLLQLSIA